MKSILLLGGTGAMGQYLSLILANTGKWEVTVTSRSERTSTHEHIHYVRGDARLDNFRNKILAIKYDVIVDFMNYDYEEYEKCHKKLTSSTDHYIWFSSCRVYAESSKPLIETSPRLLETSTDYVFLSTNRYALRKARQEDLLHKSGYNNYTIIRPYITYGTERLQLGIYEKEQWLWRLLKGKGLVINSRILDKSTTMTHGKDVARFLSHIVGDSRVKGQIIQIASSETMTWRQILKNYLDILEPILERRPNIYTSSSMQFIDELYEGGYNTIYDRVYNRSFDSSYANSFSAGPIQYIHMKEGIRDCLISFLKNENRFLGINPQFEAYQDILLDEIMTIDDFISEDLYRKYIYYRSISINELKIDRTIQLINI